jgi:hypothetical protein
MTLLEFINAPVQSLAKAVLDETRWSKYDHGQHISEATLNEVADAIGLSAPDILLGIQLRRKRKRIASKCNSMEPVA